MSRGAGRRSRPLVPGMLEHPARHGAIALMAIEHAGLRQDLTQLMLVRQSPATPRRR